MGDQSTVPAQECVSVRLYGAGQGDPVFVDRGWGGYDVLAECWKQGTFSRGSDGVAELEFVEDVGLVCRPFPYGHDTSLSEWALSPQNTATARPWQEIRPLVGRNRMRMLSQVDLSLPYWKATSTWRLPENPSIAFLVNLADCPADGAGNDLAGVVLLQFGANQWALQWHPSAGIRLLKWSKADGRYEVAEEVPEPGGSAGADVEAYRMVLLRCLRGKICISLDYGRSYTLHADPGGHDITVAAGPVTVQGCLRAVTLGIVEVHYRTGIWTSPARRTGKAREGAELAVAPWAMEPEGTSATGADATAGLPGEGPGDRAAYKLTLSPAQVTASPECWATPEVYGVTYEYPPVTVDGGDAYTTPWDNALLRVALRKPLELDQAVCSIEWEQAAPFDWGAYVEDPETGETAHVRQSWKWRKVVVMRGTQAQDGSLAMAEWFVGRLWKLAVTEKPDEPGWVRVALELVNGSQRAKRMCWENPVPLGGQDANAAIGSILDRMAVPVSARSLDAGGALVKLPRGAPETPAWMPRRGESYWETLERIARHAGMEIGCTDHEVWYTVPAGYFAGDASHAWRAPAQAYGELAREATLEFDSAESYTAIQVVGKDAKGLPVRAYVDGHDEEDPASERYSPWPEVWVEEIGGTTSAAAASEKCIGLFGEKYPLRFEVTVDGMPAALARRDLANLAGSGLGLADGDGLGVETLEHQVEGADGESTTRATGRLQ